MARNRAARCSARTQHTELAGIDTAFRQLHNEPFLKAKDRCIVRTQPISVLASRIGVWCG
jgi:hypothetical protein